jgi:hypothetical protein
VGAPGSSIAALAQLVANAQQGAAPQQRNTQAQPSKPKQQQVTGGKTQQPKAQPQQQQQQSQGQQQGGGGDVIATVLNLLPFAAAVGASIATGSGIPLAAATGLGLNSLNRARNQQDAANEQNASINAANQEALAKHAQSTQNAALFSNATGTPQIQMQEPQLQQPVEVPQAGIQQLLGGLPIGDFLQQQGLIPTLGSPGRQGDLEPIRGQEPDQQATQQFQESGIVEVPITPVRRDPTVVSGTPTNDSPTPVQAQPTSLEGVELVEPQAIAPAQVGHVPTVSRLRISGMNDRTALATSLPLTSMACSRSRGTSCSTKRSAH